MPVTRYHLAQLNVAAARAGADSEEMAGFMAGIEPVNALADGAPGFVWRLRDGDGPGATALAPCGPGVLVNMSVWETLAALRDFVYRNGPHLDYMRRRREWFHRMPQQHLVLWWVPAGRIPSLEEALARLELLRGAGSSPLAFTFREPHDPPAGALAGLARRLPARGAALARRAPGPAGGLAARYHSAQLPRRGRRWRIGWPAGDLPSRAAHAACDHGSCAASSAGYAP